MTYGSFGRLVAASLLAVVGVAAAAGTAVAQAYKQIEFQEFLVNEKEYHGKQIAMHGRWVSDQFSSNDPQWGADFFKGNGITDKGWAQFTVQFRSETKQWLFPAIERGGRADAYFAELKKLKKGDKITVYGKVKRMGDTGAHSYVEGRQKGSGGWESVPSLLIVHSFKLGWVKTMEEYIADLGNDDEAEDTIVMLVREGPGVVATLCAVAQKAANSETTRANACRALAEFGKPDVNSKLEVLVKKEGPDRVRAAALAAMAKLRVEDARAVAVEMLGAKVRDPWAADAAAELLASGYVSSGQLREACAATWDGVAGDVAKACLARGEKAYEKKTLAAAERFLTIALEVDAKSGPAYHLRGKVRLAIAETKPEQAKLAVEDFSKAVELGVSDPDLFLMHGAALLKAGDQAGAAAYADKVLVTRPGDQKALELKARAEGRSLAMINAKSMKSKGLVVRVPAPWRDIPENVDSTRGILLDMGCIAGEAKPGKPPPQIRFTVYVQEGPEVPDQPSGGGFDFGGGATPDPEGDLVRSLEHNKQTLVEKGKVEFGLPKTLGAYAIGDRLLDGTKMRTYWGICLTQRKHILCVIMADEKTFEQEKATFAEVFKSVRWEPPAGS